MRLTPQRIAARVELKIDSVHTWRGSNTEIPFTAIGAYDNPREAVIDALAFLEAATDAVSSRLEQLAEGRTATEARLENQRGYARDMAARAWRNAEVTVLSSDDLLKIVLDAYEEAMQ